MRVLLRLLRDVDQALSWVLLGSLAGRRGDDSRFVGGRGVGSLLPFTVGNSSSSGSVSHYPPMEMARA